VAGAIFVRARGRTRKPIFIRCERDTGDIDCSFNTTGSLINFARHPHRPEPTIVEVVSFFVVELA
jgi:hypothetical protein